MGTASAIVSGLLLSVCLLIPTSSRAFDIAYQVNLQVGDGFINGTITTNGGTGGDNDPIEIDSWSFGASNGISRGTVASAGRAGTSSIGEITVGNDLTADATHLFFNFGATDGGYLSFQSPTPNAAIQFICFGALVPPCIFSDPEGIAITNLNGDGFTDFQPETGNQVIGTANPSPEPATTTLLLFALALVLFARGRQS
jgi:hypothetical protein